jgi:methyltransferase (TIGR00027 family)
MTAIKDVTGTAFIVAEFRVEENNEAHPLYVDHVVPLFLSDTTRAAARAIQQDFPPAGKNLRLRTRYFDDRLDTAIAQGCRQVVILGAGLDTRAVRKSAPGVVFFEIDDAATLSFKRERLAAGGIAEPAVLIPGDYVADGVLKLLERNGFSRDVPARPAVMAVLRELASGVSRFSISLDYMDEQIIDRTTGDQPTSDFVARFAAMGAPWSFGCNDVHPLADEAGLTVVDVVSLAELHHTFWPDPSCGLDHR